jgi:tetratricopeptide (TPR) repeat protein
MLSLSGCGANKKEQTDNWETQRQKAFREFRDGHYDASIETYGKALELAKKIDPEGLQVATTLNEMATVYTTKNSGKNAAGLYLEAEKIEQSLLNKDAFNPENMRVYLDTMAGLGKIRKDDGDLAAAEDYLSKGVDIGRRANLTTKLRELLYEYKSVLQQEGKTKEATALSDEFMRLGDSEQVVDESMARERATRFLQDGDNALAAGDQARADEAYLRAYGYVKQVGDPKFRANAEGKIATYLCTINNLVAAESALKATMRDYKKSGAKETALVPYLIAFAHVETELDKHESAVNAADLALKLAKQEYKPDSVEVSSAIKTLGEAFVGTGRYDQGIPMLEKSYAMTKKHFPFDSADVIAQTCSLAQVYWAAKRQDKATALMKDYTNGLMRYPKSLPVAGRLFNDRASSTKARDEALLFANSAVTVLKKAPGGDGSDEMKRATQIVKALQTLKSS